MATAHEIRSCILLNKRAAVDAGKDQDATSAFSTTSRGERIRVSFRRADPPALSNLGVFITDRPPPEDFRTVPKVLSADGGLFVLRVPQHLWGSLGARFSDYFVYRMDATSPVLHRLPKLHDVLFRDREVAILSCGDGDYVVAALVNRPSWGQTFSLHLCRSTDGQLPECWTSQVMSVEEPLRDKLYPVPDKARSKEYHVTTKVIMLGGGKGTIGWVDLWRGIILCDVLSEKPELRDMPLPSPTKGSLTPFRNADPDFFRDITVNELNNTIKYVDMNISPGKVLFTPSESNPREYTMPIPVTSWNKWCRGGNIHSYDVIVPVDSEYYHILRELMITSDSTKQEATEATCFSLDSLQMTHPALSTGEDDIVYILCADRSLTSTKAIVGVDTRAGILQRVTKIDANIK